MSRLDLNLYIRFKDSVHFWFIINLYIKSSSHIYLKIWEEDLSKLGSVSLSKTKLFSNGVALVLILYVIINILIKDLVVNVKVTISIDNLN